MATLPQLQVQPCSLFPPIPSARSNGDLRTATTCRCWCSRRAEWRGARWRTWWPPESATATSGLPQRTRCSRPSIAPALRRHSWSRKRADSSPARRIWRWRWLHSSWRGSTAEQQRQALRDFWRWRRFTSAAHRSSRGTTRRSPRLRSPEKIASRGAARLC